jgi:hypothetical protein
VRALLALFVDALVISLAEFEGRREQCWFYVFAEWKRLCNRVSLFLPPVSLAIDWILFD